MTVARSVLPPLVLLIACACSSTYYSTLQAFGIEKRDILVDRVEDARDSQQAAKQQFTSALDAFRTLTGFEGGALGQAYERLSRELERCRTRASTVSRRIAAIEDVAGALFREWGEEITRYGDQDLRRRSEALKAETNARYKEMLASMKRAEASMQPVLTAFGDRVMFLKHNLNAQAIADLQDEVVSIETDVAALVREMERSIAEAESFITMLGGQGGA